MFVRKIHVRAVIVSVALMGTLGSATQVVVAGPIVPPPTKMVARCYSKNGPIVPPPTKMVTCRSTNGPIVPPPTK